MRHCRQSLLGLVSVAGVALFAAALGSDGLRAQQGPAPASSSAPGDAQRFLSGLRWRSIGPARGGRSITAAGSSARPLEYYFGATGGGLWKTTDGGQTWRPVADQALKTSSVGAVAVAESNPDVVYVGMGETELRGNIIQGDGVYKSIDAGKTWTHLGLEKTLAIARIRIHPSNPDIVYVAALGDPYGQNPERGIFKSTDGGKTWKRTLFRDEKTGAADLIIDPKNPSVLYASLWEVYRTPHSLSSGGPGSGLFKSTDAGDTWTEITRNAGLPKGIVGKSGIAVSGADSTRVYAIIEAQDLPGGGTGGVFSSDDAGSTWKMVNDDRRLRQRAFYYTRIYADPKEKDTVYILNTGLYRSTDAGKTIKPIRVPHGDNHDLWIAPNDPKRMINSNDGGANVSTNAGETWTEQDVPTAQFYHVVTTSHVPYHVCGAQQDNSTACVPSNGNGDYLYDVGGGESGYIAVDPKDTDVFYAGSYGGLLTRLNRRTGERRAVNPWPDNPMGYASGAMTERFQWTYPIVVSPVDPKVLYATSQHVWRSTNEGQTWEKISPDLTRHDPSTLGESGGPITLDQTGVETYATVFSLAPSPVDAGTIWAGSDDGLVNVTRDGGKTWQNVTPDLPEFSRISLIEASPHQAGTAYVAANRYQRADRAPYVFKTSDYGKTWTKIITGVAAGDFARAIREDKVRQGLLFLGTEMGIYVSFDGGAQWQPLRLNLPVTPVHDIAIKDNDAVIATHGRSFYVLDNISVLRQLDSQIMTSAVHLFTPPDATRSLGRGASIDYFLKSDADRVTIDILDGQGQVIRTFSGSPEEDKKRQAAQSDTQPQAEEEEESPRRPSVPRVGYKTGMNRFTWDLRYAPATEFPNLIMWSGSVRGPIAPPAQYTVRLTAGGETQTRTFRVKRHPLGSATDADLAEQFTLARQINQRLSDANQAVIRIRALKDQIKDRQSKSTDKKLTQGGAALTTKLTEIEGEIYQYRNRSSQDPLNFPIKLNNKLAALQSIVESGDAKPTDNSYVVFKDLSGRLDQQLARLDAATRTDLEAFNKLLVGKKLEPISDKPAPSGSAATK